MATIKKRAKFKRQAFEWKPFSEKQLEVITNATARINALDGPVRSGKTIANTVAWINYIRNAPYDSLLMTGKTRDTLYRNVLADFFRIIGTKNYRYNRSEGILHCFGKEIYCLGANDEKAESRVRGMTVGGWYANEVTLYPESFVKQALARMSLEGSRAFWDMNPDSPYHYLYTEYLTNEELIAAGILKRFQFVLDDNLSLSREYVESLKKLYSGMWYKRLIDGLWVLAEGAIYDMWDEDKHVIVCPKKYSEYCVAIDYATASVMTFGLYGITDNKVYLIKEFYYDAQKKGRQKTDSEFADDFKEFLGDIHPRHIYLDPSAASFKVELKKKGYSQVRDADNDVINGIRLVSSFLSTGRFFVDESCTDTITEFGSYVWDPKAQKKGEDKPLKENDHAMDRNRYLILSRFGKDRKLKASKSLY